MSPQPRPWPDTPRTLAAPVVDNPHAPAYPRQEVHGCEGGEPGRQPAGLVRLASPRRTRRLRAADFEPMIELARLSQSVRVARDPRCRPARG